MIRAIAALAVLCGASLFSGHALAFVDPPTISPPNPTTQTPIAVFVRAGGCHGFFADGIAPELVELPEGRLDLIIEGMAGLPPGHPFCVFDDFTSRFAIGKLAAGSYTLRILIRDEDLPQPVAFGSVAFTVSTPVHIPSSGPLLLLAVVTLFVLAAMRRLGRRPRSLFLVGMLCGVLAPTPAHDAHAQDRVLHVLLRQEPTAPSARDVVEGYSFASGGLPPISGLTAENAQGVDYLLPFRATGVFGIYLEAHPDTPRARLERTLVVSYPQGANLGHAAQLMRADPNVQHVYEPPAAEFATPPELTGALLASVTAAQVSPPFINWPQAVNAPRAWNYAGGWGLVATVDSGLATQHLDLAALSGLQYFGGNFMSALSRDVGRAGIAGCTLPGTCMDRNVDEAEPVAVAVGGTCDPDGDGFATPVTGGHGTHVSGLVAANATNADATQGACKHCGVEAYRAARDRCTTSGSLTPDLRTTAIDAAITLAVDQGAQVINQSFTRPGLSDPAYCSNNPLTTECDALAHATRHGVLLVAASGNNRGAILFPAADTRVVATGGLGLDLALWNLDNDPPPNHLDGCPQPPDVSKLGDECGSNFTVSLAIDGMQEVATPSHAVPSTFYPGFRWNSLGCADNADGTPGDGIGLCTGTSMSAPILSGIAGLLRSINPLVMPGSPANPSAGIRGVIADTTRATQLGQGWNPQVGYGLPDAEGAAKRVLGKVRQLTVRNRTTPLFAFYSADATDHAAVATPQMALSLIPLLSPTQSSQAPTPTYASRGSAIAGYADFPEPMTTPGAQPPRATAFVHTTEYRTRANQPQIAPLFLLRRTRPWPLGCTSGPGCNTLNRDFTLVSTIPDLEMAIGDEYELLGRQGYVFRRCSPEPTCIPEGAKPLYRLCNVAEDDCAVFLEAELATFQSQGYTTVYPAGSDPIMGYAYPNIDTDGDTLIDGFEYLIGTRPESGFGDSDGDNIPDGVEFPLADLSQSDPCDGPSITCTVTAVFDDGFE